MKPKWFDFTTIVTDVVRVEPRTDAFGEEYPGGWNITLALATATSLKLFFRDELFKRAAPNAKIGQPIALGVELPLREAP